MKEEFYLVDWMYDPEEDLFLTVYATLDGSKALKVLHRLSVTQTGVPLRLPDELNTYPDAIREIRNESVKFYYRREAEVARAEWQKGKHRVRLQPSV